jgi:transcriptional regulator with XRE-family HTH domain
VVDLSQSLAARLRSLLRGQSVNAFAKKCGIPESSMRLYIDGGMPRPEALAKIAVACHVSIDWLAAGTGPMRYEDKLQVHHEDFIRGGYLGDAAAAKLTTERVHTLMEPSREAFETLTKLGVELGLDIPARWFSVLSVQLVGRQMSVDAARAILEALKAELKGA